MALSQDTFNQAYGAGPWMAPVAGGGAFLKAMQDAEAMKMQREQAKVDADFKRQMMGENIALRREQMAASRDARTEAQAARAAAEEQKKADKMAELNVPGFMLTGEVKPAVAEAQKARQAKGEMDSLRANLDAYSKLVDQYGTMEATGTGSAQMESLGTSIKMNLKNLYELGAITGPDMAILSAQAPTPGVNLGNIFTRSKTQKAGLDTLNKTLAGSFEKSMAAKGYSPQGNSLQDRARQALNDSEATPEEKAAAKQVLGIP